jgi:hypothetical protein
VVAATRVTSFDEKNMLQGSKMKWVQFLVVLWREPLILDGFLRERKGLAVMFLDRER